MSETNTTTPRKFTGYTDDEVLALNNDQLDTAIRLEAIDRGIAPPIKLSEALRKSEWQGFEQPTDGITVFQIVLRDQYNRRETGMAFLDEDRAKACLSGCLSLYETGYGASAKKCIKDAEPTIERVFVPGATGSRKGVTFTEFFSDTADFDKVVDECVAKISSIRQAKYDAGVRAEKRAEYLRLAGGDEAIARGFWAKVERTEWPN